MTTVRRRIMILLSLLVAACLGVALAWQSFENGRADLLAEDIRREKTHSFERLLDLKSNRLRAAASDQVVAEAVTRFLGSRDREWARERLDGYLEAYRLDALWVLTREGDTLYAVAAPGKAALAAALSDPRVFGSALARAEPSQFFVQTPAGLVELRLSARWRVNGASKATGRLLVGRLWDRPYLDEIGTLAGAQARVLTEDHQQESMSRSDVVYEHRKPLFGPDRQTVGVLALDANLDGVAILRSSGRKAIAQFVLFSLLVLATLSCCLYYWVSVPLRALAAGLADNSSRQFARLLGEKTEFGEMAGLLEHSINQRTELMAEIAERKRAEEALRTSEERFRELFEDAHDIVFTLDLEGRFTSLNSAGERILGYDRAEALGTVIFRLMTPESAALAQEQLDQMLSGAAETTCYQVEVNCKDGAKVFLDLSSRLAYEFERGPGDAPALERVPVGVHGIARDVTDRKLLEDQLRQSQKMDALGRLAGGVAHDFNNMLAVISGYSQLLLDELQDHPRHQAWLTEIARAGERAAELTRRLLIFSRKSLPRPVLLELNDVVQGLEGMLHRTIGENVHLRVRLGPDVGYVQADLSQLEQVAVNLVVNARDAMPDGGEITIETRSTVLSERQPGSKGRVGPHVVLSVSDTGSGIVPEAMAHLFEPFFTTKPHGKGTGLGLATVYSIVEQSQGFITVATDAGNGSRFDIHLPQATAPTEPLPARRPIAPSVAGTGTILLVEDQPLVLGMARSILLRAGYEVLEATCGEEALECFERCGAEVDLVLTDVVMPGMSGGELVERLRERDPGLRVLCMSGHPDDLPLMRRLRDQEFAFLPKPFTPAELTRIVADLMASSPVRVPAGVARELAEPCVQ